MTSGRTTLSRKRVDDFSQGSLSTCAFGSRIQAFDSVAFLFPSRCPNSFYRKTLEVQFVCKIWLSKLTFPPTCCLITAWHSDQILQILILVIKFPDTMSCKGPILRTLSLTPNHTRGVFRKAASIMIVTPTETRQLPFIGRLLWQGCAALFWPNNPSLSLAYFTSFGPLFYAEVRRPRASPPSSPNISVPRAPPLRNH